MTTTSRLPACYGARIEKAQEELRDATVRMSNALLARLDVTSTEELTNIQWYVLGTLRSAAVYVANPFEVVREFKQRLHYFIQPSDLRWDPLGQLVEAMYTAFQELVNACQAVRDEVDPL